MAVKSELHCRMKKALTVPVSAATKGSQNKGSVVEFSISTMFLEDETIGICSKVTKLNRENNTEGEGNAKKKQSVKGGGSGGTSCGNCTLAGEVREAAGAFDRVGYEHVPREENAEADRLAKPWVEALARPKS